jgi:hypothetical protein
VALEQLSRCGWNTSPGLRVKPLLTILVCGTSLALHIHHGDYEERRSHSQENDEKDVADYIYHDT